MEKPAFDVANDNVSIDFYETTIPAEKTAARAELAVAMSVPGVKITVCPPQKRPVQRVWQPSERKAANHSRELLSWPLLNYLRRNGRHEDAELVERYYGLVALMEANPLQGQDIARSIDSMVEEARTDKLDVDDIDEAAASNWERKLKSGEIAYKGVRLREKAPGTVSRAKAATEKTIVQMQDMGIKFNERALIAQIDNRGVLERLRAAMGPIVSTFEDAVLGGATFGHIGEARHFKGKQAEAVGKSLVMIGLDAMTAEWARIAYERRKDEEQAERNAERRRAQLAARQANYVRRAA